MKILVSLSKRVFSLHFWDVVLKVDSKVLSPSSEEYTQVTRKALADLSNLGGNTLRISTLSGSSTM